MKKIQIAVDGPASSGKSTVAKIIAQDLGLIYLDTGAMYRAATAVALRNNLKVAADIIEEIKANPISFKNTSHGQMVFLGEEDVTKLIRTNEVTNNVSWVSAIPEIRTFFWWLNNKEFLTKGASSWMGAILERSSFPMQNSKFSWLPLWTSVLNVAIKKIKRRESLAI